LKYQIFIFSQYYLLYRYRILFLKSMRLDTFKSTIFIKKN
jgi:hypothetical protein